MYFDSHVHLGNINIVLTDTTKDLLGYKEYSKNTVEKYFKLALKNNISKVVAFPFPFFEKSFFIQNKYILSASKKYPFFFIPFFLPDKISFLEKEEQNFYGIKDHFYFDLNINKEKINRKELLDFAEQTHKVYIFHAHWKKWLERIQFISSNFPKLKVIVAHSARMVPFSGNNENNLMDQIKKTIPSNQLNNFYFETSTIRNSSTIIDLVNKFGEDNILWGTDFPYYKNLNENVIKEEKLTIKNAHLEDRIKNKIFEKNFRNLFQKHDIWIRHAVQLDSNNLLTIINSINNLEQKYLALSFKINLIKNEIKKANHLLVAETREGEICGFLRWSDRRDKAIMIEEIYILPKYRGMSLSFNLLKSLPANIKKIAKTYSKNNYMNNVFTKLGFIGAVTLNKTMIFWKKKIEQD